ncbi:hypothetical protein OG799_12930 [Micromonospora sp. NBC_00898]|uniref:hypothetical protein n=1 Tax=Micromonospora sp. NBC_00898 TaxID=2975981 RepID=UPI0038685642|nr:hypothetical protein OG799_12930 [Micromonospora sp. NBC_00898]
MGNVYTGTSAVVTSPGASRRDWRRRMWAGLASARALLAATVMPASPAQAYGTVDYRAAVVDTDDCHRISGVLTVYAESGGCRLYDSADDTYFVKDAGGA